LHHSEKKMSFEGDIDWEELAIRLIRENKNLKKRLHDLQESKTEKKHKVALDCFGDLESGFPLILTLCSEEERKMLLERARKKIVGGKWLGALQGGTKDKKQGRPGLTYEARFMKEREDRGELPKKMWFDKRSGKHHRAQHTRVFWVSHILLVGTGSFPCPFDEASHLCHNKLCCDVSHLIWEDPETNRKRNICKKKGECVCGCKSPCRFDCK